MCGPYGGVHPHLRLFGPGWDTYEEMSRSLAPTGVLYLYNPKVLLRNYKLSLDSSASEAAFKLNIS
jgi:hypothetical protein